MRKSTFIAVVTVGLVFTSGSAMAQAESTPTTYSERIQAQIEVTQEQVSAIDVAYTEVLNGLSPEKVADLELKMTAKIKTILNADQYELLQERIAEREKTNKMALEKPMKQHKVEAMPVELSNAFEEE